MKLKINSPVICMLLFSMLLTSIARAQQTKYSPIARPMPGNILRDKKVGDYSYRILPASNNGFGYVISQNGRIIFKQPPLQFMEAGGGKNFVKMEQADKAAITTIEKIKRGMLPTLTEGEIKVITMP